MEEGIEEPIPREWGFVEELIDTKISFICSEVGATTPPILYLTKDKRTARVMSKGKDESFVPNFREAIAKSAPYKGTRKNAKPIHYENITAYLLGQYNCVVAEGLEADDLMAVEQSNRKDTIICSRDKDLHQVEGLHYSWECGRQPSFGPVKASFNGKLKMNGDKVMGTGMSFFHYQLLVGDTVDNIPGAKGWGTKKAYNLLQGIPSPKDQFREVRNIYRALYGDNADNYLQEQLQLLWLVRSLNSDGRPVMYGVEEHERYLGNQ